MWEFLAYPDKTFHRACLYYDISPPPLHFPLLYLIPSLDQGGTYWPISEDYISHLNWRQKFPCHNIHVFYIQWRGHELRSIHCEINLILEVSINRDWFGIYLIRTWCFPYKGVSNTKDPPSHYCWKKVKLYEYFFFKLIYLLVSLTLCRFPENNIT